jgi:hypothetical protein
MKGKFLVNNHAYFITYDISNVNNYNDSSVCLNWWPVSTGVCGTTNKNRPHLLCTVCANWLPDIEDLVPDQSTIIKCAKCINEWSKH